MDVKVGDIIRPFGEDWSGIEDLVIGIDDSRVTLVRIGINGNISEFKKGSVLDISTTHNAEFVRKATKTEMVLYGSNK